VAEEAWGLRGLGLRGKEVQKFAKRLMDEEVEDEREEDKCSSGSTGLSLTKYVECAKALMKAPGSKVLGEFMAMSFRLLKKKERATERIVILTLSKVFVSLLPSYTIHTSGYRYYAGRETDNYEYSLVSEWQKYLKVITRSRSESSYSAAASLLPNVLLFNKSSKLVGKVVNGAVLKKGDVRERCLSSLKSIFRVDPGTRTVRILEVLNQIPHERVDLRILGALKEINSGALKRPEGSVDFHASTKRMTREERRVFKEVSVAPRSAKMKMWRGIQERLLRTYLSVLRDRGSAEYSFLFSEIGKLRIPGNLLEGVYAMITKALSEYRETPLSPEKILGLSRAYKALHLIYKDKLEFSRQIEDFEGVGESIVRVGEGEIEEVYESLKLLGRKKATASLIKALVQRGMHRADYGLGECVSYLLPDPPELLSEEGGFWEYYLLKGRR
jgi:Nucleolar complex-associated protein